MSYHFTIITSLNQGFLQEALNLIYGFNDDVHIRVRGSCLICDIFREKYPNSFHLLPRNSCPDCFEYKHYSYYIPRGEFLRS